jgi:hypothetical protein
LNKGSALTERKARPLAAKPLFSSAGGQLLLTMSRYYHVSPWETIEDLIKDLDFPNSEVTYNDMEATVLS